jgi:hypothetical protein
MSRPLQLGSGCLAADAAGLAPNNPDLNPIDMVWPLAKCGVGCEQPTPLKLPKWVIDQAWVDLIKKSLTGR